MKKFILPVAAACLSAAIFALSGCAPQKSPSGVSLMGVQPADVGLVSECDYFVAAEPAATTRVNAAGLHFAGDIQQLYGSENGYPQAVVVAKNSLIVNNPHFLKSFLAEVEENEEWLKTASAETVISAVSSHLPEGTTPTFNAKNLTSEVISRCGIHLVYAADDRERVESFLKEMSDVDEQSVGKVKDEFFCEELGDIVNPPADISVHAPDGAPALALAKLMHEENTFGQTSVSYNVVPSSNIQAYVTGEDPAADICILPLNAASKLLGDGSTYQMLGTVTNGNLYILSKDGASVTTENIREELNGKTIGVIQLNNVPGLTLKIILEKYDIDYEVIG